VFWKKRKQVKRPKKATSKMKKKLIIKVYFAKYTEEWFRLSEEKREELEGKARRKFEGSVENQSSGVRLTGRMKNGPRLELRNIRIWKLFRSMPNSFWN
jgi:hypothetical protein